MSSQWWMRSLAVRRATRIWWNNHAWHAVAAYTNTLYNALLRIGTGNGTKEESLLTVNASMKNFETKSALFR